MVGEILIYTGSTIPANYLLCDGSAISRSDYADLFDAIGTTYGVGDGSSTFNIPNLVGKTAIGSSVSHPIGTSGGENDVTLTEQMIPSHLHEVPAHGHSNNITAKTPELTHSITTQPMFKYTKLGGASAKASFGTATTRNTGAGTTSTMSRSTNFAITAHAAANCTMSGAITDCAALTAGNAGSGTAHNNMMPYLALTYLICASE